MKGDCNYSCRLYADGEIKIEMAPNVPQHEWVDEEGRTDKNGSCVARLVVNAKDTVQAMEHFKNFLSKVRTERSAK